MQNYQPNRLAPHGPHGHDASQTIALEMTWSKLLLNYTSPLTKPMMIGISSILNNNKIIPIVNQTIDIMFGILNIGLLYQHSTLEVPTAKVCWLHSCIHVNSSIKSTVTSDIII